MIRVLIAEDSLTVRDLLVTILESDPAIEVVGQAKDGAEALALAARLRPDLVAMDVHMPVMDGLEATKEIMATVPTPIVIMSSSSSAQEVELSLHAMRAGALMVLEKPDDPASGRFGGRQERFLGMVKAMAGVKVVRRRLPHRVIESVAPPRRLTAAARARLVAITASTGGPAALQRILADLGGDFPLPTLVVQHISSGFTRGLADWLDASCDLRVKLAEEAEPLRERTVYVAPDGWQLGVREDGRILVADAPAIDGFRPSGTYLFRSAARVYGPALVAVILTGMGSDGLDGLRAVQHAGGLVLAQDERSSVVYGMAQAAAAAGVVDAELPVGEIGPQLRALVARRNGQDAPQLP